MSELDPSETRPDPAAEADADARVRAAIAAERAAEAPREAAMEQAIDQSIERQEHAPGQGGLMARLRAALRRR